MHPRAGTYVSLFLIEGREEICAKGRCCLITPPPIHIHFQASRKGGSALPWWVLDVPQGASPHQSPRASPRRRPRLGSRVRGPGSGGTSVTCVCVCVCVSVGVCVGAAHVVMDVPSHR